MLEIPGKLDSTLNEVVSAIGSAQLRNISRNRSGGKAEYYPQNAIGH